MNNISTLTSLGQSLWLNYLRRAYIETGELGDLIDMGISGVTSSPAIFERAISCSSDYDKGIQALVKAGKPVQEIYEALVCDDCQRVADRLHPRFEITEGWDGYVSVELNPQVVSDAVATVAEARHVLAKVNRVNVMIEIPATEAGIEAIRILTADGVNINATHVFSLMTFEKIVKAYVNGLEEYFATHSVWRMAPSSVVSFSVGRLDQTLDPMLAERGLLALQSKVGIACAKMIYKRFRELFSDPNWLNLEKRGGRVLRPKWTRTMPHRFDLPDTWYLDALIGADTVMTVRPSTLQSFLRKTEVRPTIEEGMSQAEDHLDRVAEAGIDLGVIGRQIQQESLVAFESYFRAMIASVSEKRNNLELGRRRLVNHLDDFNHQVESAMTRLCDEDVMKRIWAFDTRVSPMLEKPGWLHVADVIEANISRLERFADQVLAAGYRKLLLLGPEPLTETAEMFYATLGRPSLPLKVSFAVLELEVMDLADREAAIRVSSSPDFGETFFLALSRFEQSAEKLLNLTFLFDQLAASQGKEQACRSFAAVTDPESALADMARTNRFRDCFLNDPNLDGHDLALSFYGLVPAALTGVQIRPLVDHLQRMVCNASSCNCPIRGDNHAALLGSSLISLANAGRNKLAFITSPPVEPFSQWLEQYLLGVSEDRGLPFRIAKTEPMPDAKGQGGDELFIVLNLAGDEITHNRTKALLSQGKPVIEILLHHIYDVAGLIFLWQIALVVADYFVHGGPIEIERKIPAGLVA